MATVVAVLIKLDHESAMSLPVCSPRQRGIVVTVFAGLSVGLGAGSVTASATVPGERRTKPLGPANTPERPAPFAAHTVSGGLAPLLSPPR